MVIAVVVRKEKGLTPPHLEGRAMSGRLGVVFTWLATPCSSHCSLHFVHEKVPCVPVYFLFSECRFLYFLLFVNFCAM